MAPHEITITIRKPEDLFKDSPDENPMQPDWEADSGMQRVADFLKTRRLGKGVRMTIQYPDTLEVRADSKERLAQAIGRYCDARITENAREREFIIQTGLTGLSYSLIVSIILAVGMSWLVEQLPLAPWLSTLLVGLFTIGSWAILWGPLAAIFFDWLPKWTAIRVYRTIKRGDVILKPVTLIESDSVF